MRRTSDLIIAGAMRQIAAAMAAGKLRTSHRGIENVPVQGPALLIARHYHHLYDGLAFFAALSRQFHILVTLDWARSTATKLSMKCLTRMARWPVLLRADAVGRDQAEGKSLFTHGDIRRYQQRALRDSVELLREGRLLVIFPEGYPNIDPGFTPKSRAEEFLPFQSGFAVIAKLAERELSIAIPLVPVGIAYSAAPVWHAHVSFGAPVFAKEFSTRSQLIQNLEASVRHLSVIPAQ